MQTLTNNAINEILREKDYTPEEAMAFLRDREHFISVSEGLKRELRNHGCHTDDDERLLSDFKEILKKAGFTTDQRKHASAWLNESKLPSPRYNYPVRLCFAFGLKGQAALDFLWKVCKVNGFNFRRADDVVYCYCLENGKTYDEAGAIINKYGAYTAEMQYEKSDATKRTHTLRAVFNNLGSMSEIEFLELLCANKKNFIEYSITANEELERICTNLKRILKSDIKEYNRFKGYAALSGYDYDISIYPEIVYAFDRISKASVGADTTFGSVMDNFPQSRYLADILNDVSAATDKEHDKARKLFLLLFFANYALDTPPDSFFSDFVYEANETLDRCGYAKLYPANPYDWLILSCIKSLDALDQTEDLTPVELFNDVLELLADESYS